MQQSSELFFASSNSHKFEEAQRILSNLGLNIRSFKTTLEEIQSNSMCEIAKRKAIDAYSKKQKPVIIEDDGLFINSLEGFPGPYSSYVYDTIGNKGIYVCWKILNFEMQSLWQLLLITMELMM